MISIIEALNYRCLRYIRQELGPFHVLVGPNASGKTTFLDVVAFLGRLVSDGPEAALNERTNNFLDLLWAGQGDRFELAVEAAIPANLRQKLKNSAYDSIRYEVSIGLDPDKARLAILWETLRLKTPKPFKKERQRSLFPQPPDPVRTITTQGGTRLAKTVVSKAGAGNDNYYSETQKRWNPSFKLGPTKSALGNLPEDESRFPVSTWFKSLLAEGIQPFVLNSIRMRKASPPGQVQSLLPDGSNLPLVIGRLKNSLRDRFDDWIAHIQTALPDIEDIRVVTREDDKHSYLKIKYNSGLDVPSWVASDGTLRLLALTLPAYLPGLTGVFLIEEPENGIHPRAVETVFQSLSSVYDAQVLLATHSPVVLSVASPDNVLCFDKTTDGATDIIRGSEHPALKDWRHEIDLGTLFAGGVLG